MPYGVLLSTWLCLSITVLPRFKGVNGVQSFDREDRPETTFPDGEFHRFVTRPDILAPRWNITMYDENAVAPGYWFIAPYKELIQPVPTDNWVGPHIYDGKGELIWSGVSFFEGFNVFDFRPIEIHGETMFTAIYPREDAGVFVDNSYQIIKMTTWPGGHGAANMHEFSVFDEGARAAVFYHITHVMSKEESKDIGYDGECWLNANGLLELDISTSPPTTLFNFSVIDHISFDEITYPTHPRINKICSNGWDSNHCNAIDRFPNGDYLISCRHTDALYKISREKGSIIWRLGGTKSDFEFVGDARFSRQHHARILEHNETHTVITLFDNARAEGIKTATYNYTRGLILSLHDNLAEVVHEYPRPDHEFSTSRGSMEILPNGNVFMCWTFHSRISEHTIDGDILMEAELPPKKNTYRAYKSPWVGRPMDPPDVYSRAVGFGSPPEYNTDVAVSWNGATDVVEWRIYSNDERGERGSLIKSFLKAGFESSMALNGWIRNLTVEAIDSQGQILGRSRIVQTIPPDRSVKIFQEEQNWLEKHMPSSINIQMQQSEEETYSDPFDVLDQDNHMPPEQWDVKSLLHRRQTVLAFLAGIMISILSLAICWTGCCFRTQIWRWRRTHEYTKVDKDEPEDEIELDERSDGKGPDDNVIERSSGSS